MFYKKKYQRASKDRVQSICFSFISFFMQYATNQERGREKERTTQLYVLSSQKCSNCKNYWF
jgi:hypothetical protein